MKIELEVKDVIGLVSALSFAGGTLEDEIFSLSYMGTNCTPTSVKYMNKYGYTESETVKELEYKFDLIKDIVNQIVNTL